MNNPEKLTTQGTIDEDNQTLENTEGEIKNGQSSETDNIGDTKRSKTKRKHNTICAGHHYTQTNTNNINKT